MARTCDPDSVDPTLLPRPSRGAPRLTADEAMALDLERVARTLRQIQDRARGLTAARLDEIAGEVLDLANELAPDLVTR